SPRHTILFTKRLASHTNGVISSRSGSSHSRFFFQAEDGIRDGHVTEFRRVLFRSFAGGEVRPGPAVAARLRHRPCAVSDRLSDRSEERRVGKECLSRGGPYRKKEK